MAIKDLVTLKYGCPIRYKRFMCFTNINILINFEVQIMVSSKKKLHEPTLLSKLKRLTDLNFFYTIANFIKQTRT